jgi:hypothetical protein
MDTAIFRASTEDDSTDGLRPAPVWEIPGVRSLLALLEPRETIESMHPDSMSLSPSSRGSVRSGSMIAFALCELAMSR